MLAGSWGAVTLQRCSIPQGCGPWGLPRGRTCPGEWAVVAPPPPRSGLQDSEGCMDWEPRGGRGSFPGAPADALQAPSRGP